jgi:hypothetical protein
MASMHQGRIVFVSMLLLVQLGGCAQSPERLAPMSLDCAQLLSVPDDAPAYLRAPRQVVELYAAVGGKYRWKDRKFSPAELQNALVNDSAQARITEVHLLSGGQPISIGHLLEVGGIAKAVCAKAMFERDGELQPINYR